jgi:urease accessory protein
MLAATPQNASQPDDIPRHWRAQLDLSFRESAARTRLAHSSHKGPLRVQRLFYPEPSGKAHCYLLHPPGGVVLGDELVINVHLHDGEVLVTTPSAGRFYSVADHSETQRQTVNLSARAGLLEWLPQETILFNGVNARLSTRIELSATAQLAFWDVLVLGRPACGEAFDCGQVTQRLEVYRDGQAQFCEHLALTAGDRLSRSLMGMAGQSTVGIMLLSTRPGRDLLDCWLAAVNEDANAGAFTATVRGDWLVARYLGQDAQRCREGFALLWTQTMQAQRGVTPAAPRIWHT